MFEAFRNYYRLLVGWIELFGLVVCFCCGFVWLVFLPSLFVFVFLQPSISDLSDQIGILFEAMVLRDAIGGWIVAKLEDAVQELLNLL